jgi:hypothetical protein
MKRFTIVKLFLSLTILVLIAAFSRPEVARAQQSWNTVNAIGCSVGCKLVCLDLPSGQKFCSCFCPPPPVD